MSDSPASPIPESVEGKIASARKYKDEGNEAFKEGKFNKARSKYATALAFTKALPGRPTTGASDPITQLAASNRHSPALAKEQIAELDELDSTLKTNIATCYIKLADGSQALRYSIEATELKPGNWKAFWRKGEAYQLLRNNEKAIEAFDQAISLAPDETFRSSIQKSKARTVQVMKSEKEKQKKAFANIFEKDRAEAEK